MKTITYLTLILCPLMSMSQAIDIEGHRGARGLAPENTIPAFLTALDLGVTTLEMDVVISQDNQVVVSHEPHLDASKCLTSDGKELTKDRENYNMYRMDYSEIKAFDCGSKPNKDFPEQDNEFAVKPLLVDVIKAAEKHVKGVTGYLVQYNIEIKSSESGDNRTHPDVETFSKLVYDVIDTYLDPNRVIIQSFDFRVLQYWHKHYPHIRLAALVANMQGVDKNIEELGFKPAIYSPYFKLINEKSIDSLHQQDVLVIPWTVNDSDKMQELIDAGVDGIITDYPDKAKALGLTVEIPYGRRK